MNIDENKVKKVFADYASLYDSTNPKIALKIVHTYKVSELCKEIAISENLSEDDVELAWLIGMLHDVGRFEQLKRYNTFMDSQSVDHALLGARILFEDGLIRNFIEDSSEDNIIDAAIRYHSAYRIPEDIDDRTKFFCHIIRDADKLDILRVQLDTPLEQIYDVTTEDLRNSEVSSQVLASFHEKHATLRSLKKTPVDHVVGHISLAFELVYKRSIQLVLEQGYLAKNMAFESYNPKTNEQMREIRDFMNAYLHENI